jgi:nuclear pore complex protein Nup214
MVTKFYSSIFQGLSADEATLSVCLTLKGLPHIYLYDSRSFMSGSPDVKPFLEIPGMTPPGVVIKEVVWNPVISPMLAIVYSNGSLALFLVKPDGTKFETATLPPGEGITCVSWSPKGKQLVAGNTQTLDLEDLLDQ